MDESERAIRIDRRVRLAVRAGARLVALLAVVALAWIARTVLLLAFLAVLLAVVMSFPVAWLQRAVGRGLAVLLVLMVGVGAAVGLGFAVAPRLAHEASNVIQSAPRAFKNAREALQRFQHVATSAAAGGARPPPQPSPATQLATRATAVALPAAKAVVEVATAVVLVIVLAAFLVHEPEVYRRGLRRLVPRRHEAVFDGVWARLRDGLRHWVGGILVSMLIMGTVTAAGLFVAGIENWALLGVLTFLGTFVPYLGAIASAVPGLLVALAQSPRHLAFAAIVYACVHLIEGYLVQPLVMRRAVELKPALLLIGQALFGAIFGVIGVVVATPALVCGEIAIGYLWTERRLDKPSR